MNVDQIADIFSALAYAILGKATDKPLFSNWIGHDLGGALEFVDGMHPSVLLDIVGEMHSGRSEKRALDFGCGSAPHRGLIEAHGYLWTGLDYAETMDPTAKGRGKDLEGVIVKYDGRRFPFENDSFDLVWSFQSLEHVNSADEAISEISRVLRVGGILAGSVSFLEPYHARSTFSYTPYGFKLLNEHFGLNLVKVFPTTDGPSLVLRWFCGMMGVPQQEWGNWDSIMKDGGAFFRVLRKRAEDTDNMHLLAEAMAQVCGHFAFIAQKN